MIYLVMEQNIFKRWNRIVGWAVFAIAALTYLLTIEPSSSLWDCGEFVATSYKLEVGHPPGAPLGNGGSVRQRRSMGAGTGYSGRGAEDVGCVGDY